MNLVYKHEKSLFIITAVLSALLWLVLIGATFGIALVYILLGYLFFLFAHSAFISHLKGSGVKISQEQYPDLHERLVKSCAKVDLKVIPEAYLLRTDFFNALATRFLGKNFIVLFTDVVDALEDRPGAIDFYIGHELGHIHRKHLVWNGFIIPGSIFPIIGTALRRAEEYTCDRYGAACCQSEDDIKAAIAAIAAGDTRWKSINIDAYLKQIAFTNGFWMSFNELTGDYPWLTKRMAAAIAFSKGEEVKHPRRHLFAWILSIFIPRLGAGAGGGVVSLMMTVAIIGILAAVAIPQYNDFKQKARHISAYTEAQVVQQKVTDYVLEKNEWPESLQALGYESDSIEDATNDYSISIYENGMVAAHVGTDAAGEPQYIVIEPSVEEGKLDWQCYGDNVVEKHLPANCK